VIEPGFARDETAGAELRRVREQRGLTVFQVCSELKLKDQVLRAIESGQHSLLPDMPFALGYVRTYARFLGLDARNLSERFKAEAGGAPPAATLIAPKPLAQRRLSGGMMVAASVLLAAAIYGGWYIHFTDPRVPTAQADRSPIPAAAAAHAPERVVDPREAADGPLPYYKWAEEEERNRPPMPHSASAAEAPYRMPQAAPIAEPHGLPVDEILLKASAQVWIQILDDGGAQVFHAIMEAGNEYRLPKGKRLIANIGNPNGLVVTLGKRTLKPLSPTGRPLHNFSLDAADLAKLP
jgi:hypothetical protein